MSRLYKVGDVAKYLGVSIQTIRRWESIGRLKPLPHKPGETRYYSESQFINLKSLPSQNTKDLTIGYARVSTLTTMFQ